MDANHDSTSGSEIDRTQIELKPLNLRARLRREIETLAKETRVPRTSPSLSEVGTAREVGMGTVVAYGLPHVANEELVEFPGRVPGLAFDLSPHSVGVVLLGSHEGLSAGDPVRRTGRVLDFPVGDELIGRVVNPMGQPLDDKGAVRTHHRRAVEQPAPTILERAPVEVPLQTGIRVIDALFPIGRGQRELIVGDRQTGKTSIALNAILNQHSSNVDCIYCAIGKRDSAVAQAISELESRGAMEYTTVIAASGEDAPGLLFVAPFAAMSLAEHFMRQGRDVLVVYDDLTQHARAYRALSLLLRRPPGREAYPGDIFYLHSRLLERATHLRDEHGGGSITVLPIVETYAQNISDYIPTNLISITDGQIYVSPVLFRQGQLPAVDIGKSVSRVGGKAQLPAYRMVAGSLRLAYSQFEELESFTRFGTQLDPETRKTLEHGQRIREVFKQREFGTIPVAAQIAALVAANEGFLDEIPADRVDDAVRYIRQHVRDRIPEVCERMEAGEQLSDDGRERLVEITRELVGESTESSHGDA